MYLFRHSDYERLYNCTNIRVDDVSLPQRQHVPEAIITIILCAIYYVRFILANLEHYINWKYLYILYREGLKFSHLKDQWSKLTVKVP